ncbi:MAG: Ku protein [Deltaproteobacteria bacterium]|nr:Ku protein [Deltaproteobacteria bacterium]
MAARSTGSGTISFGLVSIPVRLYVATSSESLAFNMLHEPCRSRIRQQLFCPACERVVERREIVKGYQCSKDQYVLFADEELKALEAAANRSIDIHEFVPLSKVDPVYFEDAHYLGPEAGAEKAYGLLVRSMRDTGKGALAQWTSHGKEHLVLIRALDAGLVMHALYYADEVRSLAEISGAAGAAPARPAEIELARKLIEQLSSDEFRPEAYHDAHRDRVLAVVERKTAGREVVAPPDTVAPRAQVIDLMDVLKESLARGRSPKTRGTAGRADERAGRIPGARRPAAGVGARTAAPKRAPKKSG